MQTNLCRNRTLGLAAPNSDLYLHNCATTWAFFEGKRGHPEYLQMETVLKARRAGYLFARKYKTPLDFHIDSQIRANLKACPSTLLKKQLYMPPWVPAQHLPPWVPAQHLDMGSDLDRIINGDFLKQFPPPQGSRKDSQPSVSFVFLLENGFPAKTAWDNFFNICTAQQQPVSALIFSTTTSSIAHPNVASDSKTLDASPPCPQTTWGACGQLPTHSSMGASMRMIMMHMGAQQSPPHSTVVFLSGQTVPLVTCQAAVNFLIGKILVEYERTTWVDQCRGPPWMSVPREIWRENVYFNDYKRQLSRGAPPGTAEEWWMQSHLCLNTTLRVAPMGSSNVVHNCATTITTQALDPNRLSDYVKKGFLFAKVSLHNMAQMPTLTLSNRTGTVCAQTMQTSDRYIWVSEIIFHSMNPPSSPTDNTWSLSVTPRLLISVISWSPC